MMGITYRQSVFGILLLALSCCGYAQRRYENIDFRITEETEARVFGNLITASGLQGDFNSSQISQFRFALLSSSPLPLSVGERDGNVGTTSRVDRDTLCAQEEECFFMIDFTVTSQLTLVALVKTTIYILDTNDLSPVFAQGTYALTIPETASIGRTWPLPLATDSDSPAFGIQDYRLDPFSTVFLLNVAQIDGQFELSLELRSALDREQKAAYNLTLLALDPQNRGRLSVLITVSDSNDNPPIFRSQNYTVNIVENYPQTIDIISVSATDADIGDNGRILYSFDAATQNAHGRLFSINDNTGAIRVTGTVDYEETESYRLGVIARDQGVDSLQATTRVLINVLDANDCVPEVTINALGGDSGSARVMEGVPVGTFVAQVLVSDADSGNNGLVTCSLNDNVFQLVPETQGEYRIQTAAIVDRETADIYNLAIMCNDQGEIPQRTLKQITVNVEDANDHAPVFSRNAYTFSIRENSGGGTLVATLSATDQDIGVNAQITYELSRNVGLLLYLTELGGNGVEVRTIASFDREALPQVRFTITARDGGNPSRNTSADIVLNIEDVNDERPRFDREAYVFEREEEQLPYLPLGIVNATDRDSFPSNIITYSLAPQSNALFTINQQSGELKSGERLDRESQASYSIVVVATDNGVPPQSASVTVTLNLIDINDNNPEFEFPRADNNTVYIANTHDVGSMVTQVHANDADNGAFGTVSYYFDRSSREFAINPTSGVISLVAELSGIENQVFSLMIIAQDQGVPPRQANHTLFINVNQTLSEQSSVEGAEKPNETAVIAVACVAGILIVLLGLGIGCILCKRRYVLQKKNDSMRNNFVTIQPHAHGYAHKQECVDTHCIPCRDNLSFEPSTPSPKEHDSMVKKQDLKFGGSPMKQLHIDTSSGVHGMAAVPHNNTASPLQEEGEQERDTSSAEGSNADSGRGASEEGESNLQASFNTHAQRYGRAAPGAQFTDSHLGFESPGRRVLYNKAGSASNGASNANNNMSQGSPQAPAIPPHEPSHSKRTQSQGRGDLRPAIPVITIQRAESYRSEIPVQYFDGSCSKDVYV